MVTQNVIWKYRCILYDDCRTSSIFASSSFSFAASSAPMKECISKKGTSRSRYSQDETVFYSTHFLLQEYRDRIEHYRLAIHIQIRVVCFCLLHYRIDVAHKSACS